jgi:DNA primase
LDAAKQICQDFGIPVNADTYVSAKYKDHTAVHKFCMELFQKNNDPGAHRYWEQRGLSTTVQKYGLGWCPKNLKLRDILRRKFPDIHGSTLDAMGLYDQYGDCKFGGRYMFTIFDGSGHPIGFAGRSLTDPAKYINSIETDYFKKGRLLYNWHIAKGYPSVIVVEGYTDCLALVQSGIPYVVATMGSALTKEHLVLLEGKEIVLAFDNDNTGQESMAKIIEQNPAREFYVLQIPDAYKDYGEALAAGENLMRLTNHQHRRHRADWLLGYLSRTIDLSELSGREHLYNRMNALARHVSPVTKDYITIKIQRKLKGERAA